MVTEQDALDRIHRCQGCGEIGRYKQVLNKRGRLMLYCHDEEKSCYNHAVRVLLQQQAARQEAAA